MKMNKIFIAMLISTFVTGTVYASITPRPFCKKSRIKAETTVSYTLSFTGGTKAKVFLRGDGDTDLDLYVYDMNHKLIGKDIDSCASCIVTWIPKRTGKFIIKVRNRGRVYNNYELMVN